VNAVAFSPNGIYLAAGTSGEKIWLWNMQNLRQSPTVLEGHHDRVLSLAFSPDGQTLASGAEDQEIRLCNLEDLQAQPEVLRGHDAMVFDVAFSPDGRLLASGCDDETIRLWELYASEGSLRMLPSPFDEASPDEDSFPDEASSGEESLFAQRRSDRRNPEANAEAPSIQSIAFSNDGQTVYAATEQHEIITWPHEQQAEILPFFGGAKHKVTSSAFAPDKTRVALGDDAGNIHLWNIDNTTLFPQTLSGHTGSVDALAFHPDGIMLASGGDDFTIRVWKNLQDPATQPPLVLRGHEGTILSLAFHPAKEVLVSGGADGAVLLWNLQFPDYPPISLTGHEEEVFATAFTPDGTALASLSEDSSLYLWDLKNLRTDFIWLLQLYFASRVLYEGEESFFSLAFSPDGNTLAVRGSHNIRLWNFDNLEANPVILEDLSQSRQDATSQAQNQPLSSPGISPLHPLETEEDDDAIAAHPLAFSPEGEVLAAAGRRNASVILWTRTEALVEAVCQRVWRNLNEEEWQDYIGSGVPYEPTCPNFQ
jgi:WD40 repeat protein